MNLTFDEITALARAERERQDAKHGTQLDFAPSQHIGWIVEELGEAHQAVSPHEYGFDGKHHEDMDWRKEVVQVIALGYKMLETCDTEARRWVK